MPTPVAHTLAGFAVWLGSNQQAKRQTGLLVLLLVLVSNLPDVDFVAGYFVGDPRVYHWRATHSVLAAISVAIVFGLLFRSRLGTFQRAAWAGGVAYGSHLMLDMLMGQPHDPSIGLQLFWPFSQQRFMAPWEVFHMAPHSIEWLGPLRTLFSRAILPVIQREVLVIVPVIVAIAALRFLRTPKREPQMET